MSFLFIQAIPTNSSLLPVLPIVPILPV